MIALAMLTTVGASPCLSQESKEFAPLKELMEIQMKVAEYRPNIAIDAPGTYSFLFGSKLPFKNNNPRCSLAIMFKYSNPVGLEQEFDGSDSISIAGDVDQIDISFMTRQTLGTREEVCLKATDEGECSIPGYSISVRVPPLDHEVQRELFRPLPIWRLPGGQLTYPKPWEENYGISGVGRGKMDDMMTQDIRASYFLGASSSNHNMTLLFLPEDIERGAELLQAIVAECGRTYSD